jgi:hypothetical protein
MVKLIKKLSNEFFNLKKNTREGPSRPRNFHPFFKRNDNQIKPPKVPQLTLNMDKFGMDNLSYYY